MQSFIDFAARRQECGLALYVATGPSASRATDFADLGDAAVMGEAGSTIPGRIALMLFNNTIRAHAAIPLFARTDWILCPESLVNDAGLWENVADYEWLPKAKLVTYPRRKSRVSGHIRRMRKSLQKRELTAFNFSVLGLLALVLLRYQVIWCFGHDGGFGRDPKMLGGDDRSFDYTDRALQVRKMARVIEQETAVRVHFWPDRPPRVSP